MEASQRLQKASKCYTGQFKSLELFCLNYYLKKSSGILCLYDRKLLLAPPSIGAILYCHAANMWAKFYLLPAWGRFDLYSQWEWYTWLLESEFLIDTTAEVSVPLHSFSYEYNTYVYGFIALATYWLARATYRLARATYWLARATYWLARATYRLARATYWLARATYWLAQATYRLAWATYWLARATHWDIHIDTTPNKLFFWPLK